VCVTHFVRSLSFARVLCVSRFSVAISWSSRGERNAGRAIVPESHLPAPCVVPLLSPLSLSSPFLTLFPLPLMSPKRARGYYRALCTVSRSFILPFLLFAPVLSPPFPIRGCFLLSVGSQIDGRTTCIMQSEKKRTLFSLSLFPRSSPFSSNRALLSPLNEIIDYVAIVSLSFLMSTAYV